MVTEVKICFDLSKSTKESLCKRLRMDTFREKLLMLANATRRWQPCFLRYSLTGDRFFCALENYSFGKVQDSRDVRCVRLEFLSPISRLDCLNLDIPRDLLEYAGTSQLVVRLGRLFWTSGTAVSLYYNSSLWVGALVLCLLLCLQERTA